MIGMYIMDYIYYIDYILKEGKILHVFIIIYCSFRMFK